MIMAQDAALGYLLIATEENEDFPKPSNVKEIKLQNENGFVSLLLLDLGKYMQKYGDRKNVKKVLNIPTWLNEKAQKQNINFSQTLQEALLYKVAHKIN